MVVYNRSEQLAARKAQRRARNALILAVFLLGTTVGAVVVARRRP